MSRTITQEVNFNVEASKVYDALTKPNQFSEFTGGKKAKIDLSTGGQYSLFDGMITGLVVDAVENSRLTQVWRVGLWEEGVYSLVKFEIIDSSEGSTLRLEHTGFPEGEKEHLDTGWDKMYWQPLKTFLS